MDNEQQQIITWLKEDSLRMAALSAAASLNLHQAYLAAGFVRNLVWDKLSIAETTTPLNDIDVIHFDRNICSRDADLASEQALINIVDLPWSVKNQARMHKRNGDHEYRSTMDALCYWTETETAVGARLNPANGEVELVSAFGFSCLFENTITLNPKRPKLNDFNQRIAEKKWLTLWPQLRVIN